MLCEECGSNNPQGSQRCQDCGSPLATNGQPPAAKPEEVGRNTVSEAPKIGKTALVGISEATPAVIVVPSSQSTFPAAVEGRTSKAVVPIEPVHVYGPSDSSLITAAPRPDYPASPAATHQRNQIPKIVIGTSVLLMVAVIGSIGYFSRAKKIPNEVSSVIPAPASQKAPEPKGPPPAPSGMVLVPGGVFTMGRNDGDSYSAPAHSVTVQPFYMDRTEVTNAAYQQFVRSTNHQAPPDWINGQSPSDKDNLPVVRVTWYDAAAYAQWAGKRLPTETEWEFAARGNDGRLYPWGNAWQPQLAITKEAGTAGPLAVGSRPEGASPFGVLDLCGNVIEWVADDFRPYQGSKAQARKETFKVLRGGGFRTGQKESDATYRSYNYPNYNDIYSEIGFRCAKDIATNN